MQPGKSTYLIVAIVAFALAGVVDAAAQTTPKPLAGDALLTEVQNREFRFFWDKSDPTTGLTNDRARNVGGEDEYTVASIASTGYALASLPVAVQHKWVTKAQAYDRALLTLKYVCERFPNEHGWYYHFIDKHTGARVWNCELSSIDTALLLLGALESGEYWKGTEVNRLANRIYDRVDWTWMRTDGGKQPDKLTLAMGWKPETGFLENNWDHYCELMFLYILGLGANKNPLPRESWNAWERNLYSHGKYTTLAGGPIFMHQMAQIYFNMKDQRDSSGWDYWVSSTSATLMNRDYCIELSATRKSYGPNIWALNACDAPDGYNAFGVPSPENGTVSTTGAIASIIYTPVLSRASADETYRRFADRMWGRYGFSDSFNLDRGWFDPDVIGIDLGMALLAIEDVRSGLPWKLLASHPSMHRGMDRAGFHHTVEPLPRALRKEPASMPN